MKTANFLVTSFFLLGISSVVVAKRRNVVVFFADDGGFQQSAYNNTDCDTPNLDKLAERSVTFRHGYTSVSSCSPSRSVMLTGLPQHQNGMYGLQHGDNKFRSFDDVKSLPGILSNNSIFTGIIGKYHIGPDYVYPFDYMHIDMDQDGRNITNMKNLMREFLNFAKGNNTAFYLYMGIHDPHRSPRSPMGNFMNLWGDGEPGHGLIEDWKPIRYDPAKINVPYFLPDTPATRSDLAEMYTTFNRLDQGIGLFMDLLREFEVLNDTLIMWTSDNGIPFPNAKTNLYEPGMGEPMMISSPDHEEHWGKMSDALVSTMDFVPTILDWFDVEYPDYKLMGKKVNLTGRSMLPLAANPDNIQDYPYVFSSHDFHEVTMSYPMRVIRNQRYRLIHNLNYGLPYPLATDLFNNPTFYDILERSRAGQPTNWFKTLDQYYYRDEWELFDLDKDPKELNNVATDPAYASVLQEMNNTLTEWMWATADPWRCMPHSVYTSGHCAYIYNEGS